MSTKFYLEAMNVFKNIYTQISVRKSRWKTALMLLDHLLSFVQLMGNLLGLGEFNVRVLKLGLCFFKPPFSSYEDDQS